MYDDALRQIQASILGQHYVATLHAEQEMSDDGLTIVDVEHAILTGEVVERQRDTSTGEWKYCIGGNTVDGSHVEAVVKIGQARRVVIYTAYLAS